MIGDNFRRAWDLSVEILGDLLKNKSVTIAEASREINVSRDKIRSITGLGAGNRATPEFSDRAVFRLIDFVDQKTRGMGPSTQTVALAEKIAELRSLAEPDEARRSGISQVIDLDATYVDTNPSHESFNLISGCFYVLRRVPDGYDVLVSALEVGYQESDGFVSWRNHHPLTDSSYSYNGFVFLQGSHFTFVGQREDNRFVNMFSVRRASKGSKYLHGIGFVETDDTPTLCRVLLIRSKVRSMEDIISECRKMSPEECKKIGLHHEHYIDILPYNKGNYIDLDNKKAVIARN